ncbi:MAG: hypothetical protein HW421_1244 [Ignavibacteria bacterium]|nr:hypothetical protein [Ignavibacteria bacterium]
MEINILPEIVCLLAFLIMLYTFLCYPVLLKLLAKLKQTPIKLNKPYEPEVTVLIAAYNEEKYIRDAIESINNSNYPINKIKIIVGSDGSTDNTSGFVRELAAKYSNIQIFEFARLGKNRLLNELLSKFNTELTFFLDADCRINADALGLLVEKFSDPDVGASLASLDILTSKDNDNTGRFGEMMYQKYEASIRHYETIIQSTVNSLGTLYGVRSNLIDKLPNDLVCDDMFMLMITNLKKKRVVYEHRAKVYEVREKSLPDERKRRVRLIAGGLETILQVKKLLLPGYGWVSFFLWSHKVLRWLSPIYLIVIAICTFYMQVFSIMWYFFVIGQILFYLSGIFGWLCEKTGIKIFIFRAALFFISMNVAFLQGLTRFAVRGQNAKWERIDTETALKN